MGAWSCYRTTQQSCRADLLTEVAELIDPVAETSRHTELIRQTLVADDVPVTVSVPICEQSEGFLAWHHARKGTVFCQVSRQVAPGCYAARTEYAEPW